MKLKIPPALQVAFFALLMWLIKKITNVSHFEFEAQIIISKVLFLLGVIIAIIAIYSFRKARTTVDPIHPDKATELVVVGIYKFTRNPMYLGMLFILLAFAIKLGNFYALPVVFLYVWYITTFQIRPEEKALTTLFGEEYLDYCNLVRRWL